MYPPLGAFSTPVAAIYQVGELFPLEKSKKKNRDNIPNKSCTVIGRYT